MAWEEVVAWGVVWEVEEVVDGWEGINREQAPLVFAFALLVDPRFHMSEVFRAMA